MVCYGAAFNGLPVFVFFFLLKNGSDVFRTYVDDGCLNGKSDLVIH